MNTACKNLLFNGIEALRQGDKDIERLIAPRSEAVLLLLERYINEIELFNPAYGLVGVANTEELIIKHILDSLAPLGIISRLLADSLTANHGGTDTVQIADAGSGAGLPGIPLAITLPCCDFTLIERMGRRAGFLWNTKAALAAQGSLAAKSSLADIGCLGLSNVSVEEGELEKTAPKRFALVTFRAFKPLEPTLLKTLFNTCIQGGIIAAFKGRREKVEQEMAPLEKLCGQWEAIPCSVPFLDEERHLLVIKQPNWHKS